MCGRREACQGAEFGLPGEVIHKLPSLLQDIHKDVRELPVRVLGANPIFFDETCKSAREVLLWLKSRDRHVRLAAVSFLDQQNHLPESVILEIVACAMDGDASIRLAARKCLCERPLSDEAVPDITALLKNAAPDIRLAVLEAVRGRVWCNKSFQDVVSLFKDETRTSDEPPSTP